MHKTMNKIPLTIGSKFLEKFPDKIPVVVHYKDVMLLKSAKTMTSNLLIPKDNSIGYILVIVRRNFKIPHTQSLFLFVNSTLVDTKDTLDLVYSKYKNPSDGCLHVFVGKESTFN